MKSLKEWLSEQDMTSINRTSATNVLGGTTSSVDTKIRSMLRSEIERIIKANENLDPLTLFREIMSAVVSLLEDVKGTRITTKNIMDLSDLGQKEGENDPQV
jgi:hypothetical protein